MVPEDFSENIEAEKNPEIEMHFSNYIDDLAKNHRIYQAEVIWSFYEKIGIPEPPLAIQEVYPLPQMVDWFDIVAVGVNTA